MFVNSTRSSVCIMAEVQHSHKLFSFRNPSIRVSDQNFAAIRQKALIWYKHTLPVHICSQRLTGG